MLKTMILSAILSLVALPALGSDTAVADPVVSDLPWGDPNGPLPCVAAPPDTTSICLNLYAIECGKYRNTWHGCADDPNPSQCRAGARSWYLQNIENLSDCDISRPALVLDALFNGSPPPGSEWVFEKLTI